MTPGSLGFFMSFWLFLLRLFSFSPRICSSDLLFSFYDFTLHDFILFPTLSCPPTLMASKSVSHLWSYPCASCSKTHWLSGHFHFDFSEGSQTQCVQNLFDHLLPLPGVLFPLYSPCWWRAPTRNLGVILNSHPSWALHKVLPILSSICPFPLIFIATALEQSLIISWLDYCSILLFSLTLVMVSLNPCPNCYQSGFPKMHISSCYSICYGTHRCCPIGIKVKLLKL